MKHALKIQVGPKAKYEIEQNGFSQDLVKMMYGASGGPKWLILSELDRYLCGHFFSERKTPLQLVGSSIGSWRFACYAQKDSVAALERFRAFYMNIGKGESVEAIRNADIVERSRTTYAIVDSILGEKGEFVGEILNNKQFKLNFIACECRGLLQSENTFLLGLGVGVATLANKLHRQTLSAFFKRALFCTGEGLASKTFDQFPTHIISLLETNLRSALYSTASIPFASLAGFGIVNGKKGALYRDGGMIDYHFDIENGLDSGVVLYPHFYDFALPGWFDKLGAKRYATRRNYDRVVMISPSEELMYRLPLKRLSDRSDFEKMEIEDRINYWNQIVEMGKYIADEFHEITQKGNLLELATDFNASFR